MSSKTRLELQVYFRYVAFFLHARNQPSPSFLVSEMSDQADRCQVALLQSWLENNAVKE